MRTIPAEIPALSAPTAAQLWTHKAAIEELQTKIDWTQTWVVDQSVPTFQLVGIPSDLAILTVYCAAQTDDTTHGSVDAIHATLNGDASYAAYPFRYTYISGTGQNVNTYCEEQLYSARLFVGMAKTSSVSAHPAASSVTFTNWGTGSNELVYSGHINTMNQNGIVGGYSTVSRPFTTMELFVTYGNWVPGSTFTLVGRYP